MHRFHYRRRRSFWYRIRSELLLEFPDERTSDEICFFDHGLHGLIDVALDRQVLASQVHEGYVHCRSAFVYGSWSIYLITRAGFPMTTAPGGTSLTTTDPAPTRAFSPMTIPGNIVEFAPIFAPFLTKGPARVSFAPGEADTWRS